MQPCPNCGESTEEGATHCANCGASLLPVEVGPTYTRSRKCDIVLGAVLAAVSSCLVVGLIVVPLILVYGYLPYSYPSIARGLRIGLIIGAMLFVAILCGLIFNTCFVSTSW